MFRRQVYRHFSVTVDTGPHTDISVTKKAIGDSSDPAESDIHDNTTASPLAARPKLVHHVFRWGVGNAFRAQSKNRYRPTHAERNTAVSLREGYFDCDRQFERCKVTYDKLNEQWEVLWKEFGKINGKPFPVKKFGIEASKAESISFAEQLDKRLQEQYKGEEEPTKEPGLTFDHTLHCWVALGRVGRRPVARAYSADFHGYESARKLQTGAYLECNNVGATIRRPRASAILSSVQSFLDLMYKRMKLGAWPPEGASPLHPIEPWGKQFFVFNTTQGGQPETLLCVTNHERKPLMYLRREDFEALVRQLEANWRNLQEPDLRYEMRRLEVLEDNYAMQRMKTGRHSSHTIMRARLRNKK
ncbi:uncharacterized protein BXIN_1182 [Babesia sp. Xinjiang]|uniref:uncharacterized protein n=1 Tax=Babesia sp. Xinjiang TaxID=462227 RepID=UPI000A224539|nr:uncharacterized protein BXIN_1182 [Babesia sp. Xinjiang]ORM40034.1 hypothetical protein BXIN_1182 [Babesia sp. Xinjiang]